MNRRALLGGLVALALAPAAMAAPAATVEVFVVRAERGDPYVDPALRAVAKELASLPYQRFTLVGQATSSGPTGTAARVKAAGLVVRAEVGALTDAAATVTVDISRDGTGITHTTFSRPWGRASVVSAGKHEGGMLVVPVRVSR